MCASYLLVLLVARRLPLAALAVAIVLANVIVALGPPLISQDVFGYLAFARLGVLHGLDPYTHIAAEAPSDAVFHFIGWPFQNSPYGPLFTLLSYALVPLGPAGALWAFKAIAVLSSLGAVALVARAASRLGQSPSWAAAFVGLNPVLVLLAVAGAHNDTLVMLALAAALALTAGVRATSCAYARRRGGAGRRRRHQGHGGPGAAVPRAGAATPARARAAGARGVRRAAGGRAGGAARLRRSHLRLRRRRRRAAAARGLAQHPR